MTNPQKITPYLWFDTQAEAAAVLYTSIFPDSSIKSIQHQGEAVQMVSFSLSGQAFTALNGGPMFTPNPSVSFYVVCEKESEIDHAWAKLMEGGTAFMPLGAYKWSDKYGWVQDKYGISWQLTLGAISDTGQKITPALMFTGPQHGKAEAAIHFYTATFNSTTPQPSNPTTPQLSNPTTPQLSNPKTPQLSNPTTLKLLDRYEPGDNDPATGTIKHAQFWLGDSLMMAMDSSYMKDASFNEAISFVVNCKGQEEVDHFWNTFTVDGGEEMMCAWCKDKYGVVWQIVPEALPKLLSDPDPERAQRAVGAMMQMKKIDIEKLHLAADGKIPTVITVQTNVHATIETVWEKWTHPDHIVNWNFAVDTWHCPRAHNDLQVGGTFNYRMEAKDGSMGFHFTGTYTDVQPQKSLAYTLDDGRNVEVHFTKVKGGTFVMETFEAEPDNPIDMQRGGWQAILENFKKYAEKEEV